MWHKSQFQARKLKFYEKLFNISKVIYDYFFNMNGDSTMNLINTTHYYGRKENIALEHCYRQQKWDKGKRVAYVTKWDKC